MGNIISIYEYAEQIGVPEQEITGSSRRYEHKIPRHLYWLYLKTRGLSNRRIARMFNMCHSSIVNGIRTASHLIETEDHILSPYEPFIETFLHLQEQE